MTVVLLLTLAHAMCTSRVLPRAEWSLPHPVSIFGLLAAGGCIVASIGQALNFSYNEGHGSRREC